MTNKSITEIITGMESIPADKLQIERNGKYAVYVTPYKLWDAKLIRGKWILDGNWKPNYAKK